MVQCLHECMHVRHVIMHVLVLAPQERKLDTVATLRYPVLTILTYVQTT